MRQIDEQFLETPFFGIRQMTWHLRNEGHLVNEKRIRRLIRLMGNARKLAQALIRRRFDSFLIPSLNSSP